jgi:hypothetical protein
MAGKPVQWEIDAMHLNPHCAVHGAVPDALADTGMGVALYPPFADGEICATRRIWCDEALVAQANEKGAIFGPRGEA